MINLNSFYKIFKWKKIPFEYRLTKPFIESYLFELHRSSNFYLYDGWRNPYPVNRNTAIYNKIKQKIEHDLLKDWWKLMKIW